MEIQTVIYQQGRKCRIFALGRDGRFPFLDFIERCHKTHPKELARLEALLSRFGDAGKIHDTAKVNALGDGLYEFKTVGGLRVTWFWEAGYCVICGHCFIKKTQKTPRKELEAARKWYEIYLQAKAEKKINKVD